MSSLSNTNATSNTKKRLFNVWLMMFTAWALMTTIPAVSSEKTGRLVADFDDRRVYFQRGKWFTENTPLISEYPQIPTFLFGINHLTSMWLVDVDQQFGIYTAVISLEMMLVLYLVFKLLFQLLPSHLTNRAFLLFLPPTLYFAYNRFDILPAYFCLVAFSLASKKQWTTASVLLALGTFTKWYPVLLFPGFFMYATMTEKKIRWNMLWSFTAVSIIIMLASYLQGGPVTILTPLKFHLNRGMEYTALPVIISNLLHSLFSINIKNLPYLFSLFFILQVSAPLLILVTKIDTLEALTHYSIIVIGAFTLFSRIWSPQWFLWLLPFLILSAKDRQNTMLIIAYNIASYVGFPLVFDRYGGASFQLQAVSLLIYVILFTLIVRSIRNIKFSNIHVTLKNLSNPAAGVQ